MRSNLLSLVGVVLCLHTAVALDQQPRTGESYARQISDNGDPELSRSLVLRLHGVWDMYQDRFGFMWFGTTDGLVRYDGYDLTTFRHVPFDSTSLSSSRIRGLYEDDDGALWVGTMNGGLNLLDRETGRFTRFRHVRDDPQSLDSDQEIRAIAQDRNGTIWVGTDKGLNRFDQQGGTFTRIRHGIGDGPIKIDAFLLDREGTFWIGTNKGLFRLHSDRSNSGSRSMTLIPHDIQSRKTESTSTPFAVTSIAEDAFGMLWLGTDRGLLRIEPTTGRHRVFLLDAANPSSASEITEAASGIDVVGTTGPVVQDVVSDPRAPHILWLAIAGRGLGRFDTRNEQFTGYRHHADDENSVSSNSPLSLYADRFGSLWVGSLNTVDQFQIASTDGIAYHRIRGDSAHLDAPMVSSIYEDRTGALWVGLLQGGVAKTGGLSFSGGSITRIDRSTGHVERWKHVPDDPSSLSDGIVASILEDHTGQLWIGNWGGGLNLMEQATGTFTHFRHDPEDTTSLSSDRVTTLFEDSAGSLWIGTNKQGGVDTGGLNRLDVETGQIERFIHRPDDPSSLSSVTVTALTEDSAGRLWVGTDHGLSLMDRSRNTFRSFRHDAADPRSLLDNYITALYADSSGLLWVGTPSGLDRLDPKSGIFTHITERDAFIGGAVMGILPDEDGHLWITTRAGLFRLNTRTGSIRNYGGDTALATTQYLLGAYYRSARGELFFPDPEGMLSFFPRRLRSSSVPPSVVLTDIRPSDGSVRRRSGDASARLRNVAEEVRLPYDQNSIEFEYVALHFKNAAKNTYAYQFYGFDEGWVQGGTQRTARYTNLAAGSYLFHVKAANSDGVWNEEGASIRIVIAPPWWRTTWAYLFYGLLLLGSIVAADRFQRRRIVRRERAQAQIHEIRIRAEALASERRHMELALEKARELELANARLKAHEKQLEEQALRLRTLDEIKSRFFANISHEFRTPLTLILGPIDDALRDHRTIDDHTIRGMRRSARRLLRLIDQLLALARLEHGSMTLQPRRFDLVAGTRNIVLSFVARAERQEITLSLQSTREQLEVHLDLDKFETILTNLLSNALKFTPRGGKIGVSVGMDDEDDDGPYARIMVRDTGEGIPPDELPYVFDRFYQAGGGSRRRREGLGIGLALSNELAKLHGGALSVESQVGFGATFLVRLPMSASHLHAEDVDQPGSQSAATAGRFVSRLPDAASGDGTLEGEATSFDATEPSDHPPDADLVLVAEDNPDLRASLRRRLSEQYEVIEARDGEEGLALVRRYKPALVIADVMMPKLDGLALCREIKVDTATSEIPVVLLTARAAEEDVLEGLQTGADDYLTKPFNAEELVLRVENLIEIRRHLRDRYRDEVIIRPGEAVVSSEAAAFLERVRGAIEERMSESNFGVDQLAEDLHMSTRQLQRRIKEGAGLSASGCIRLMRMERAAQLLEKGAGRISEVASAVGYADAKHFSRRFRQVFGILPSEFGRRTRQNG